MNNSKTNKKRISFAISFLVLFSFCSNIMLAQSVTQTSNCFSISVVGVTDGTQCSCTNTCGTNPYDGQQCTICVDVTICMDSCSGINPSAFTVTSESSTDCHTVCSPTGDFTNCATCGEVGDLCSWSNPRTMLSTHAGGVADNTCVHFRICRNSTGTDAPPAHQTYDIAIAHPLNPNCGGIPCRVAKIQF